MFDPLGIYEVQAWWAPWAYGPWVARIPARTDFLAIGVIIHVITGEGLLEGGDPLQIELDVGLGPPAAETIVKRLSYVGALSRVGVVHLPFIDRETGRPAPLKVEAGARLSLRCRVNRKGIVSLFCQIETEREDEHGTG